MSAVDAQGTNLPSKKLKSHKKMAHLEQSAIQIASNDERIQIAQAENYYGWVFDDGVDEYYYWYPSSDVVVEETWIEYKATCQHLNRRPRFPQRGRFRQRSMQIAQQT
jgi:hypothetical protein